MMDSGQNKNSDFLKNKTQSEKDYALLIYAREDFPNSAYKLFKAGANIEAKNSDGQTPLILATLSNQLNMVKFLIKYGAELNAIDNTGYTALMHAYEKKQIEIIFNLLFAMSEKQIEHAEKTAPYLSSIIKLFRDCVPHDGESAFSNFSILVEFSPLSAELQHKKKKFVLF